MNDPDQHQLYFSTFCELYHSNQKETRHQILLTMVKYGHFSSLLNYLRKCWFSGNISPKTATTNMEFFIDYVLTANDEKINIDYGPLADFAQFFFRMLCQKPTPSDFKKYNRFLFIVFDELKKYDINALFNVLIKCPFESALLPLSTFGVVAPNYSLKVIQLLFTLSATAIQKDSSKIIWVEAFTLFISNVKEEIPSEMDKIVEMIQKILDDATVSIDQKLKLLFNLSNTIPAEKTSMIYDKFYPILLKNISPKITLDGIAYVFGVATQYYNMKDENHKSDVLEPLFINALPFFYNSPDGQIEEAAINFSKCLPEHLLQQWIFTIIDGSSFIRAALFFVSHFPNPNTLYVLFDRTYNPTYYNAQCEAIVYFLKHHKMVINLNYLLSVFKILKAENLNVIDLIIDYDDKIYFETYIKAAIIFLHTCIDIHKIHHFADIFSKKKIIPIVEPPENINHSVLTLSVHFFGYKRSHAQIYALISYLKACHDCEKTKLKEFNFLNVINDGKNKRWPNGVHDIITEDKDWCEQLFKLGLERLGKQEFQMCFVLAAISPDVSILHNSTLLLLKEKNLVPILYIAAATNWEKELFQELKNLISESSKTTDDSKLFSFSTFSSLFKKQTPQVHQQLYQNVDIISIVLTIIETVSIYFQYSQMMLDVLFSAFPANQTSSLLSQSHKAVITVCKQMKNREVIHSIIERMISTASNVTDFATFENALVIAINCNQSMTEDLAIKVSTVYLNMVIKNQISKDSKFEEAFFDKNYESITLTAFTKVFLELFNKPSIEENLEYFQSLQRALQIDSKRLLIFQKYEHILVSNLFASNPNIRKIAQSSLIKIENLNDIQTLKDPTTNLMTVANFYGGNHHFKAVQNLKPLIGSLMKRISFDKSKALSELLLNHFAQTSTNNRIAILLFIDHAVHNFTKRYLEEQGKILELLFKAIKKTNLKQDVVINNLYLDILTAFSNQDFSLLIPYLIEFTTFKTLNHSHIQVLSQNPSFISSFSDFLVSMINLHAPRSTQNASQNQVRQLPVEIISRATQILLVLITVLDLKRCNDDLILSLIIIICLTVQTYSKWTDSFRNQHIKILIKCIHKYCQLNILQMKKLSKKKFSTQLDILSIIQQIFQRTGFGFQKLEKLKNTNFFYLIHFYEAVKLHGNEYNTYIDILIKDCQDSDFVIEVLPVLISYFADSMTIEKLKKLSVEALTNFLLAIINSFKKNIAISTKKNFLMFLRIIIVIDDEFVVKKVDELLKVMSYVTAKETDLISTEEFSTVLFKIVKLVPDPVVFLNNFNVIITKMAESLISSAGDQNKISRFFFDTIFAQKSTSIKLQNQTNSSKMNHDDFQSIFSSLYSLYLAYDKNSPRRYIELASYVISAAEKRQQQAFSKLTLNDNLLILAIMKPVVMFSNTKAKDVCQQYISLLQNIASQSDPETFPKILEILEDFTSPKKGITLSS